MGGWLSDCCGWVAWDSVQKMMQFMTVWCGWTRETEVPSAVFDCGAGAGQIPCLECGGTGDWTPFHPENIPTECVDCKGTGLIFVSI